MSEKEREEPGAEISVSAVGGSARCPARRRDPGHLQAKPRHKTAML